MKQPTAERVDLAAPLFLVPGVESASAMYAVHTCIYLARWEAVAEGKHGL